MIVAKNIRKSFGHLEVLKGIDFEIKAQEFVAIVGASGAGKTTLLQIISTLDKPDSGSVLIDDVAIHDLSSQKQSLFRNQKIGFIFQFHQLLAEFSALENVMMPALIAKQSPQEAEAKAIALMERLNLKDRFSHRPSELSGGEKQRIAVARALINSPSVIFADEPTGNLDSQNRKDLHALFALLREEFKQTIVIVSHDHDIESIADRTLHIK
ncbi:MAG: ABC transporter ATP-binding protein, partial [Bacteroidales bacterium]|nr:ABC transporter ATP-binding protein [Bacteroidales bacterium]